MMDALLPIIKIKLMWLARYMLLPMSIAMHGSVLASSMDNISAAQLQVTPKPCVALRKGQKCYLEVTFSWQHPYVNDYCLVNSTTNKTMKCWQKKASGEFSFDFQSTQSNNFALRKQASSTDIARATIPVAWVYKASKRAKSTWRLF